MAETPKSVDITVNVPGLTEQVRKTLSEEMIRIRQEGVDEGFNEGLTVALEVLRRRYLEDDDRPARGSVEGEVMIQLAREISDEVRGLRRGTTR